MRRVTLFAVKRPGWLPSITRPSPELFGLIEATSNAGTDGLLCGACARSRGAFTAATMRGAARTPSAVAVARRPLHDRRRSVETLFIVASRQGRSLNNTLGRGSGVGSWGPASDRAGVRGGAVALARRKRGNGAPARGGVGGPRGRSPPDLARHAARNKNFVLVSS